MIAAGLRATHGRLELTMHEVNDNRLVAVQMVTPRLLRSQLLRLLGRHVVVLFGRHKRLNFYAIQVFVQAVEQNVRQFLAVLLLAVGELFFEPGENGFKCGWYDQRVVMLPELAQNSSERGRHLPHRAERVLRVDFVNE